MARSYGRVQFGPGSVIYLVVMGLITFAAMYTQANLLFWALGLVVGALVVSLGSALISLRGIEVRRLAPSRGVVDEPLVLRYHVENRSRLACFSVEIVETWRAGRVKRGSLKRPRQRGGGRAKESPIPNPQPPTPMSEPRGRDGGSRLWGRPHGWVLHVGPGQSIQAEATCWPRQRGPLRFESILVRSGFPFGIIRKSVRFTQSSEVLVHPPQRRLSRQIVLGLSSQDIGHARHADRGGGTDEFFGLRPYRPGDGYKLIDWKHSARGSQLVSREMAKARPPRMMILLDLVVPPEVHAGAASGAWAQAREEAVNLAGALVRESQHHGIHVGLAVRGAACPWLAMHNSPSHRQRLLDCLARLDLSNPEPAGYSPAQPTVVVKVSAPEPGSDEIPKATILNTSRGGRGLGRPVLSASGDWPDTNAQAVLA